MSDKTAPPPIGDNKPPLHEAAKADISEQLRPLEPRLAELVAALGRAKCDTPENAGKCADLVKQFKKLGQRIDNVRKDVKEPYAEAVSVIDAAPKSMQAQIAEADRTLRGMMAEFDRKQREKEAQERREREERERAERERIAEEQRRAEAAGAKMIAPEPEPEVLESRRAEPAPVAVGDYGASAHRRVTKVAVIEDVYALPEDVLNAPDVHEAILKVVRRLRQANPDMEIKGIRIEELTSLQVR